VCHGCLGKRRKEARKYWRMKKSSEFIINIIF
jgi:hypothetical protein